MYGRRLGSLLLTVGRPASQTRYLAKGGILLAINWILLNLAAYSPTAKLSFLALSSFTVLICYCETDLRLTLIFYVASALLALIRPGIIQAGLFALYFGLYPLIGAVIGRFYRRKDKGVVFLRVLLGAACLILIMYLVGMEKVIPPKWSHLADNPFYMLAIIAFSVTYLLDWVLGLLSDYYENRIKKASS